MIALPRLHHSTRSNRLPSLLKVPILLFVGGLTVGGCSRTTPTSPVTTAAPGATAARAVVDAVTGNARASRDKARSLRQESDQQFAAKDYKGAMESRLKMLNAQTNKSSTFGALNFYAIQSLTLVDLPKVATHLDAASCRVYAAQLKALDARVPSYQTILQQEKATQLANLTKRHKDPKFWQSMTSAMGRTPQKQQALDQMTTAQIEANITKVYDAAIVAASRPYSSEELHIAVDPYTSSLAYPSSTNRFLWTKFKTDRLLAIAALQNKADALEKKPQNAPLPADPFGTGPLKRKNSLIYSVGPDTKDDGGKPIPRPNYAQVRDKGDMPAPTL